MPPARRFPPPWSADERYRQGSERAGAGIRLFRGRAGPAHSGQSARARRGAADCGRHRQRREWRYGNKAVHHRGDCRNRKTANPECRRALRKILSPRQRMLSTSFALDCCRRPESSRHVRPPFCLAEKTHMLALFSALRLHKVQAMMNLRQTLEAGAAAAFAIAEPEIQHLWTLTKTEYLTLRRS
jgi:hypothetical protein